jgi:hypothetical protein
MKWNGCTLAAVALMGLSAGTAQAQNLRAERLELYPPEGQVGIVNRLLTDTAWIRVPQRVQNGAPAEFMLFSEGSDVVARGVVRFVTPTPPYEAYVTGIRAIKTTHPQSPFKDKFAIGSLYGLKRDIGVTTLDDSFGVGLAVGNYVRVAKDTNTGGEGVEPVRAHIAALRAIGSPFAVKIAAAASKALVADPLRDEETDEPVDYSALTDALKPFRRVQITDPVTQKLFTRLYWLARDNGVFTEKVSTDFLRSPDDVNASQLGNLGGSNRLR